MAALQRNGRIPREREPEAFAPGRRQLVVLALAVLVLASVAVGLTAGAAAAPVLLGDGLVEQKVDSDAAGVAEAFRATAGATGTLGKVTIYVDASSTAPKLIVGVYADSAGHPGALLGQGSLLAPAPGAWNDVSLSGGSVTAGANYWIALLAPSGTIQYRDRCCGGGGSSPSETHAQTGLSALPTTWTTGARYNDGPLSAYVSSASGTQAVLSVNPGSLSFGALQGGPSPAPAPLSIANTGSGTLPCPDSVDAPWLGATPSNGSAPAVLTVSVATAGLAVGSYTGHVTVSSPGALGSPTVVTVTLNISAPGFSSDWLTVDGDPGRSGNAAAETVLSPANVANLTP